ncbi:TrfB-related DNA-binding protein [Paraburkholderia sp. GAS32]|uniref:TrfB-related DNA-binding protein n=1 Tax=Paraburkholderia sp. GAS32 TaxID=3035129 RepID=UPI003D19412D
MTKTIAKVAPLHVAADSQFPRMTAKEFSAIKTRLKRMTPETIEVARRIFVNGEHYAIVADATGLKRQRVHYIATRVLEIKAEIPADWEQVECWLPAALAAKWREAETKAKAKIKR